MLPHKSIMMKLTPEQVMDAKMPDPAMLKILPDGATPLLRGSIGGAS